MREEIRRLKQVKIEKDKLLQQALSLDLKIKSLENELHDTKMKQSKIAYEIEHINKKVFDMIEDLR